MTVSGEELGADLYELRRAGRIKLPEIAAYFAQATRHLHNTSWDERDAFDEGWHAEYELNERNVGFDDSEVEIFNDNESLGQTATVTEGEFLGAVFGPWTSLRDQLQVYLAGTANSLLDAGTALEGIADAYAATDEAAAAYLEAESAGLGDGPEQPEIMYPGSEHDTVEEERDVTISTPLGDVTILEYDVEVPQEEPTNPLGGS